MQDQEYARAGWTDVRAERDRLTGELEQLGWKVLPSQANFILATVPDGDGGAVYRRAQAAGASWCDTSTSPGLSDKIRITIGRPDENDALLAALRVMPQTGVAPRIRRTGPRPRDRLLARPCWRWRTSAASAPCPRSWPDLPWMTLVALPDQGAGVALLERGRRRRRGAALAARPPAGGPRPGGDVPGAGGRHRRRPGRSCRPPTGRRPIPTAWASTTWTSAGHFERVAGRRSGLLAEAGAARAKADPLDPRR